MQRIFREGDIAPGTNGAVFLHNSSSRPRAGFTSAGVAALQYGTSSGDGIWKYSPSGGLVPLALGGQLAPSLPGLKLGNFSIRGRVTSMSLAVGGNGYSAFHADLIDSATRQYAGSAVFRSDGGTDFEPIIATGDVFQDGTGRAFLTARQYFVSDGLDANADGAVALFASIESTAESEPRDAIVVLDAEGSTRVVAEEGSAAPGLPGVTFDQLGIVDLSQNGDLAFTAMLSGEVTSPTLSDRSIWLARNGQDPTLLIRQGTPVPGIDGATFSGFNVYGGNWLLPDGSVVFEGFVGYGARGVWIAGPDGNVEVVGTGKTILSNGDPFRVRRALGVSGSGSVYLVDSNLDNVAVWNRNGGLQPFVDPQALVPHADDPYFNFDFLEVNEEGWVVFSGIVAERSDTAPRLKTAASESPLQWAGIWRMNPDGIVDSILLEEVESRRGPATALLSLQYARILDISGRGEVLLEGYEDGVFGMHYYGPIPEPTAIHTLAMGIAMFCAISRRSRQCLSS